MVDARKGGKDHKGEEKQEGAELFGAKQEGENSHKPQGQAPKGSGTRR